MCWATCSGEAAPRTLTVALCTVFGVEAVELIAAGQYGYMVAYQGNRVDAGEDHGSGRAIEDGPAHGGFVRTARALGVCLGD